MVWNLASNSFKGGVDETTMAWKEPAPLSEENLTNNPKVFTMSYEQRAMDLDSLSAPEGHVLTGLKFRKLGGHLNLEIQVNHVRHLIDFIIHIHLAVLVNITYIELMPSVNELLFRGSTH